MDQRLIKLKPATCQSPDLPAIHLTTSSIKNDTTAQRPEVRTASFHFHTDAAAQRKIDRRNEQISITGNVQTNVFKTKISLFALSFVGTISTPITNHFTLLLAPMDRSAVNSLWLSYCLLHPHPSNYPQLFLFLLENVHSSGP